MSNPDVELSTLGALIRTTEAPFDPWKGTARVATTAGITLSGTQTVDGVALSVGDVVLDKNNATASARGLYVVASGAWTRTTDCAAGTNLAGAQVRILAGSVSAGLVYGQTVTPCVSGTDSQTWSIGASSGSVTTVSVVTANGVSGTVATATTTPAITLALGAIAPTSVAASGTVTGSNLSGTHSGTSSGTNTGDQTNITGNAATASAVAASALTGTTLASGVTASSLTSFGASVALGTPASVVLTNATGTAASLTAGVASAVAASGITGTTLASGVTASSLTSFGASIALGTPASCVATNFTGTAASLTAGVASAVAASGITGTTLASGVTASSLTSFGSSPTIVTPTVASLANMNHNHTNAAGGGTLDLTTAFAATILPIANGGTATATGALGRYAIGANDTLIQPHARTRGASLTTVSGTTYAIYLGYTTVSKAAVRIFGFLVSTSLGAGAQTAEYALASSPAAPNGANQTLTKLVADGTISGLTTNNTTIKNTSSFSYTVAAGVHLWACVRTAMATTQPTFAACGPNMGLGEVLTATGVGALTSATTWTGVVPADTTTTPAPELTLTSAF
jgi:hypothetical protein